MSQNRTPAGVPTGGQFAAQAHSEASIALDVDVVISIPTDDDTEECAWCGWPVDDGEGWDGYCGPCADRNEAHDTGEHADDPVEECPYCN